VANRHAKNCRYFACGRSMVATFKHANSLQSLIGIALKARFCKLANKIKKLQQIRIETYKEQFAQ